MQVTQYSFQKRIILDPSLFRIPESLIRVFVTDAVEEAIRKSGLIGFQFIDLEAPPRDIPVS
jgi:hypothetical protein